MFFFFFVVAGVNSGGNLRVRLAIISGGKWLGNLPKFFVVCFCWLFRGGGG